MRGNSKTWTPQRIECLRRLREEEKCLWREIGTKLGIKLETACAAYIYYCEPEKRQKRKVEGEGTPKPEKRYRAAKPKPEKRKRISAASPTSLGPDDLPIGAGRRVPERVGADHAITRPDAPPPSPSARRYLGAMQDDILLRIQAQGITAGLFGDPPPGRSALDRRGETT